MASARNPIRVAIIDDHKTILWGLSMLIEQHGPEMELAGTATNGAEALALVAKERPDVTLLDLQLGQEDGLDLLPQLMRVGGTRVIIVTGELDTETHDRAARLGARGVVLKTQPAEVILRAIERVHGGELWLDRAATGRVFAALSGRGQEEDDEEPEKGRIASLTEREREIVSLMGEGLKSKEIAARLFISEPTVRNYLSTIYNKLGVRDRLELMMFALKHGLTKSRR